MNREVLRRFNDGSEIGVIVDRTASGTPVRIFVDMVFEEIRRQPERLRACKLRPREFASQLGSVKERVLRARIRWAGIDLANPLHLRRSQTRRTVGTFALQFRGIEF